MFLPARDTILYFYCMSRKVECVWCQWAYRFKREKSYSGFCINSTLFTTLLVRHSIAYNKHRTQNKHIKAQKSILDIKMQMETNRTLNVCPYIHLLNFILISTNNNETPIQRCQLCKSGTCENVWSFNIHNVLFFIRIFTLSIFYAYNWRLR